VPPICLSYLGWTAFSLSISWVFIIDFDTNSNFSTATIATTITKISTIANETQFDYDCSSILCLIYLEMISKARPIDIIRSYGFDAI